jgi:N-acetylneuraminate synthase
VNSVNIIAEVGLAHDGSLTQAHAYIDAIKRAGADAAKFQCHADDSTTEWRVKLGWQKTESRQEYWKRTGFKAEEWRGLKAHCDDLGLEFMCSPFSVQAVPFLDGLVRRWKLPSGQVTNKALLDALGATRKPVLLSTGMATLEEVNEAAERLIGHGCEVRLMQCTTRYPCPPELVGLPLVPHWGGLSDHSGTIWPGIAAAALGCQVLEVHVCWSKAQGGFDTDASITVDQLRELVAGVRFVERALANVDKDALAGELEDTRRIFMGAA